LLAIDEISIMDRLSSNHKETLNRRVFILTPNPPACPPNTANNRDELKLVMQQMRESKESPERTMMIKIFDNSFIDDFLRMLPDGSAHSFRSLCEIITSDMETLVLRQKLMHKRPRPVEVAKAEGFRLEKFASDTDDSPSYPSGHAAGSRILALSLGDIFPHRKSVLIKLSELVGRSRIDGGVHFPSDVEAGFKWAESVWNASRNTGMRLSEYKIKKPE
jgi:hypothetical protein